MAYGNLSKQNDEGRQSFWEFFIGWLVVLTCFIHLEKYDFVNGKDDNPYMKWKIKAMCESTNQLILGNFGVTPGQDPKNRTSTVLLSRCLCLLHLLLW